MTKKTFYKLKTHVSFLDTSRKEHLLFSQKAVITINAQIANLMHVMRSTTIWMHWNSKILYQKWGLN